MTQQHKHRQHQIYTHRHHKHRQQQQQQRRHNNNAATTTITNTRTYQATCDGWVILAASASRTGCGSRTRLTLTGYGQVVEVGVGSSWTIVVRWQHGSLWTVVSWVTGAVRFSETFYSAGKTSRALFAVGHCTLVCVSVEGAPGAWDRGVCARRAVVSAAEKYHMLLLT